jgi:hypothetical protein
MVSQVSSLDFLVSLSVVCEIKICRNGCLYNLDLFCSEHRTELRGLCFHFYCFLLIDLQIVEYITVSQYEETK